MTTTGGGVQKPRSNCDRSTPSRHGDHMSNKLDEDYVTAIDHATLRTFGDYSRAEIVAVKEERRRMLDPELVEYVARAEPPSGWKWSETAQLAGYICGLVRA